MPIWCQPGADGLNLAKLCFKSEMWPPKIFSEGSGMIGCCDCRYVFCSSDVDAVLKFATKFLRLDFCNKPKQADALGDFMTRIGNKKSKSTEFNFFENWRQFFVWLFSLLSLQNVL